MCLEATRPRDTEFSIAIYSKRPNHSNCVILTPTSQWLAKLIRLLDLVWEGSKKQTIVDPALVHLRDAS